MRFWNSLAITGWLFAGSAYAAECLDVFPDPAASYAAASEIRFQLNSKLIGSDGELTFNTIVDNSRGNSCDTQPCTSGPASSANLSLESFRFSSASRDYIVRANTSRNLRAGDYDDITMQNNAELILNTQNGIYLIDTLNAGLNSTVELEGGEYWIRSLVLEQGASIIVTGTIPTTIYVENARFKLNSRINAEQSPANLTLIAYDDVRFDQGSRANGYFYAVNDMQLQLNAEIVGAVNTVDLSLAQGSKITYAPTELLSADFGTTCTNSDPLPDPIGHWPFDLCTVTGAVGEITDIVGSNNGQALKGAGIEFEGKYCQAGSFEGTGDVVSIPHTDDYHLPEGAISFWFRVPDLSFSNRRAAGGMGIFSKDSTSLDDGGHLTIWVTSSGALRARQQTDVISRTIQSANLINENQWHHVTHTWGQDGIRLYVDGTEVASSSSFLGGLGFNREPIILAANAWQTGNNSSISSLLRDLFRGQIDDLKIFDDQLSAPQVMSLFNIAEGDCTTCTTDPELTAHWPMDLCSVDGSNGEVIDIVGDSHGATIGDAGTINDGKFCQAGRLAGNGAHINIPDTNAMALSSGSVSMWIKTSDLSFTNTPENGGMGLLSRDSRNFDGGGHLTIRVERDGKIKVRHQSSSQSFDVESPANAITENTWHMVTYSFGNRRMRLFVDGQLVATNASFASGIAGNNEPLILGATARISGDGESTPNQLRDFFKGEIDDVRLYRNELANADVEELYSSSGYVCVNCTGDRPVAFYQFEEEEYTGAGQILDSSANAFDGDPIGNVQPILPDVSVSCRALDVPQNFRVNEVDALNSKLDINEIGGRGTISLWYRSTNAWVGGNNRQIFDASQLANPPARNNGQDKYFFLVLRNDGRLRFAMEDNLDRDFRADTSPIRIDANEWVHIAVTWDLVNDTAQIYVNGNLQPVSINSTLRTSQIAGLGDLYFGDIGNTYVIAGGTDNSIYGQIDDVRVYNFNQTRAQVVADIADVTPCSTVTKYQIVHPEQALTCSSASVTIRACANDDCTQLSDLPTTVALSPAGWEGGDVVTFTGSTQVNLSQASAGLATLGVVTAEPSAPVECNPDCTVNFVNAGFEFFDTTNPASTSLPAIIAESDLGRVGIRALQDNNGVCGPLLEGPQNINLSYDCVSTADAPYSPNQCRANFAGIAVQGTGLAASSGTVNVEFNSDGEASLADYQYADAGRLSLNVSAVVDNVTVESGTTFLDSVPQQLTLASSAGNPQTAGEQFDLSITAIGALGSILPGYQPADMQMLLQRQSPLNSSVDGGLIYADGEQINSQLAASFIEVEAVAFTNGVYNYPQAYFEEVGTVAWDVRDLTYLGETIDASSITLGRFIPAYFEVSTIDQGTLADSCSSSFTYIGQPFGFELGMEPSVSVTARNALGNVTANYAGDTIVNDAFGNMTPDIAQIGFSDSAGYTSDSIEENKGQLAIVGQNRFDGSAEITISNTELLYPKLATSTEPFDSSVDLILSSDFFTDSDGVCFQSSYPDSCEGYTIANITGTEQRYGRLVVNNSYGPESETIFLPLSAEYFVGGSWRLNPQDSCTPITLSESASDIIVTNASVGEFEQDITGFLNDTSSSGFLNAGLSDETDILLGPPLNGAGEAIRGSVTVTLNPGTSAPWESYLNIDWNNDGIINNSDAPSGIATFGIYRGNDRTIHWREVFE